MKKLLLTSILFLLTITTTFADQNCKTQTAKKDYGIGNLKSTILNIGEKIVKKSDETKLEKLVKVLEKIKGTNDKQKGIVNLLKDYFECEINGEEIKNVEIKGEGYKSFHDYPDSYGNYGVRSQLQKAYNLNLNEVSFYKELTVTLKSGKINNTYCVNNWHSLRFFVPPYADTVLGFNGKTNTSSRIDFRYLAGIIDHISPFTNGLSILNYPYNSYKAIMSNVGAIGYVSSYQDSIYKNKGAWIFADYVHDFANNGGQFNPEIFKVNFVYSIKIKDRVKFKFWLDNDSNFDSNGNPYILNKDGNKQGYISIINRNCSGIKEEYRIKIKD